jgi:hypothetical protein
MKSIIKRFEKFELHHQILMFLIVMLITILVTRAFVYYIYDPNPKIFGYELHHMNYGILLLAVTSLLLLFGKKHIVPYLIMTAISLGLIIDEIWFVTGSVGSGDLAIYNRSLPYALVLAVIMVIIILLLKFVSRRKK